MSDETLMRAEPIPPVIRDVAFSMDDRFLIEILGTGLVQIWDAATRTLQKVFYFGKPEKPGGQISPDGKWLAIGCSNGLTELHSLEKIAPLRKSIRQFQSSHQDASGSEIARLRRVE